VIDLYTISHPIKTRKYAADVDNAVKHDACRLVDALQKRFPPCVFVLHHTQLGSWTVQVSGISDPLVVVQRAFAEGFMASEHLWER